MGRAPNGQSKWRVCPGTGLCPGRAALHVWEDRVMGSAGKTVLETLTLLPHIPSGVWLELGFAWVYESVSLKQKEHAQVFSEGVKVGL